MSRRAETRISARADWDCMMMMCPGAGARARKRERFEKNAGEGALWEISFTYVFIYCHVFSFTLRI